MNTKTSKISLSVMADRVKTLLEKYPTARLDDHELFVKYFTTYFDSNFNMENFIKHKLNFESIARIRRKVVNMFPELKDNVANTNRIRKSISKNLKKIYC
jgi:hypothetical protein